MLDWPVHPRLRRPVSVWSAMRTMWSSTARPRLADRQSKNQGRFGKDSRRSLAKARRPAIRPIEPFAVVARYVPFTSTPAVRGARMGRKVLWPISPARPRSKAVYAGA
jgi:hypothetical protein